jgi:glycosyltransferase involved in cell wall biosynthesis
MPNNRATLRLVIVHNHFRPGGVRRVIELATPHLVRALRPRAREIVLAGGEAPGAAWLRNFRAQLGPVPVVCQIEPALRYQAEQRATPKAIRRRLRAFFVSLLGRANGSPFLVWAHNQGLGRNLLLTRELIRACAEREVRLLLHHHDWWFDQRWQRWPEMQRAAIRSLAEVAEALFPRGSHVRHVAINRDDFTLLERHFPHQAGWLPNLAERSAPPPASRVRAARRWLDARLGERSAPVWLLPCRLLRRKNIAEALLLARWLRPEAWLVTTAGISSAAELDYGERLAAAAREHGWKLRLSVLERAGPNAPTVAELMAASEAVLLTSIQEGFGLPYIEAAVAARPLLCRALPNVAPDLAHFGFRFPQGYTEILVDTRLFDWAAESARQFEMFRHWRDTLPQPARKWVRTPRWLRRGRALCAVPFSRLSLTAQLEVLAQPVARSWERCLPINPFLGVWRRRAATGRLQVTRWPRTADRWLSGRAYAERFSRLARAEMISHRRTTSRREGTTTAAAAASVDCQSDFIRAKLRPEYLYPLLWGHEP